MLDLPFFVSVNDGPRGSGELKVKIAAGVFLRDGFQFKIGTLLFPLVSACALVLCVFVFAGWHVCPRVCFSERWCVEVVFALSLQRCADVHSVRRAGLLECLACTLVCVSLKKCADLYFVNTLG